MDRIYVDNKMGRKAMGTTTGRRKEDAREINARKGEGEEGDGKVMRTCQKNFFRSAAKVRKK